MTYRQRLAQCQEFYYEQRCRAKGWTTIDEAGWCGNLICHRDHLEDRAGPEFGSWRECAKALRLAR